MTKFTGTPRRKTDGNGPTPRRRPIKKKDNGSCPSQDFEVAERGPLNAKQRRFIKWFACLNDNEHARYVAFLLAGFTGCKEDCDRMFANPRMQKLITSVRKTEFTITKTDSRSKLNEKTCRIIETALSKGMVTCNACLLAGIEEPTFYGWISKGQADLMNGKLDSNHLKFYHRVNQAKPKGELVLLDTIHDAALGQGSSESKVERTEGPGVPIEKRITVTKRQWQAAAWILERTRREHYGKDSVPEKQGISAKEEAKEILSALDLLVNNTVDGPES